jgi:hypothetical protein
LADPRTADGNSVIFYDFFAGGFALGGTIGFAVEKGLAFHAAAFIVGEFSVCRDGDRNDRRHARARYRARRRRSRKYGASTTIAGRRFESTSTTF